GLGVQLERRVLCLPPPLEEPERQLGVRLGARRGPNRLLGGVEAPLRGRLARHVAQRQRVSSHRERGRRQLLMPCLSRTVSELRWPRAGRIRLGGEAVLAGDGERRREDGRDSERRGGAHWTGG